MLYSNKKMFVNTAPTPFKGAYGISNITGEDGSQDQIGQKTWGKLRFLVSIAGPDY